MGADAAMVTERYRRDPVIFRLSAKEREIAEWRSFPCSVDGSLAAALDKQTVSSLNA